MCVYCLFISSPMFIFSPGVSSRVWCMFLNVIEQELNTVFLVIFIYELTYSDPDSLRTIVLMFVKEYTRV